MDGVGAVRMRAEAAGAVTGLSDPMVQASAVGALLCLLGWAAWWLSGRDATLQRHGRLFAAPPKAGGQRDRRGRAVRQVCGQQVLDRSGCDTYQGSVHRLGTKLRSGVRTSPELLLLPMGLLAAWPTRSPLVAAAAAGAVVPAIRLRRRRRAAGLRERRRTAVVGLCAALAGELRTGATPHQAVEMAAGEFLAPAVQSTSSSPGSAPALTVTSGAVPLDCTVLVAAVRYGGSVPDAFRVLAELPGAEGAAGIAACWQVASSSGAGLAAVLDRVAEGLRAERSLRENVRAELAGPRSTALLLAGLPLFGLLLGAALGADPLRMLLHTPTGLLCLLGGALLEWSGLAWTARIARGAETAAAADAAVAAA